MVDIHDAEDLERLVARSLRYAAGDAPPTLGLAEGARRRLARRRRSRVGAAALATAAVIVGGTWFAATQHDGQGTLPQPAVHLHGQVDTGLPNGWRWEYYSSVGIAVPGDWGYGVAFEPWCLREADTPGYVGRPGPIRMIGCAPKEVATRVDPGGTHVWFLMAPEHPDGAETVNDQTTVWLQGVMVAVQADQPLRDRILATLHTAQVDENDCPTSDPISADPTLRPDNPVDVSSLTGVTSVSACKYGYQETQTASPGNLISSIRLDGTQAAAAVHGIQESAVGGGPDDPGQCMPALGSEIIVLRITSDQGLHEVYLRYSGCQEHGFDDGVHLRTLTHEAIAPFISGINSYAELSGPMGSIWSGK